GTIERAGSTGSTSSIDERTCACPRYTHEPVTPSPNEAYITGAAGITDRLRGGRTGPGVRRLGRSVRGSVGSLAPRAKGGRERGGRQPDPGGPDRTRDPIEGRDRG